MSATDGTLILAPIPPSAGRTDGPPPTVHRMDLPAIETSPGFLAGVPVRPQVHRMPHSAIERPPGVR